MQTNAQQRASEKPLEAFYSPAMKERMNAPKPSSTTVNTNQKRASEKPLSAFTTAEVRTRLKPANSQPAPSPGVKRASEKPLPLLYQKAIQEKKKTRTDSLQRVPVRAATQ
jgi:hypothetical protein